MPDVVIPINVHDHAAHELTEDAAALSFCEAVPLLRYVAAWNRWMQWNSICWTEDSTLAVYDMIRQHGRRLATGRGKDNGLTRAQGIAAIERLVKSDRRYAATVDQWDKDDMLLNTPGGIVDLQTGKLLAQDPGYYLTKSTTVPPGAECKLWLKFLNDVTGSDQQYIAFLQRVIGYSITGMTKEHALFFLFGTGGNGKGTFLNTISRILGEYAVTSGMDTFVETRTDRHPTELALLRGARLVLAQETEEGKAWAEAKIKALTGGDPITARYMRQDFFTFEPKFKLLIAGNHKPSLRNVDEAIRRRLHLLPFTKSFSRDGCDKDLPEKLMAEACGILRWMIEGCLAYQHQGLTPPEVVTDATAEYFAAENVFDQWLQDSCEIGPDFREIPSRLFAAWKIYAEARNERTGNQKLMAERLANANFTNGNSRAMGGRYWAGLRLKDTENGGRDRWNVGDIR